MRGDMAGAALNQLRRRLRLWSSVCSLVVLLAFTPRASTDVGGGMVAGTRNEAVKGGVSPQGSSQPPLKLGNDPNCLSDIRKFCRNQNPNFMNDLSVLECLQNNVPKGEDISIECQHSLWMAKKKLSNDVKLPTAAGALCAVDQQTILECNGFDERKSFIIPCLIDHLDNVNNSQCKEFLQKMKAIVFSDYRLVYRFVESCENDITKLKCGRLDDDNDDAKKSIHNQGDTISCLSEKLAILDPNCRRQILRVAELQSNDYHNDRQLFLACQDDREKFCSQVKSGNGKTYQCLAAHKFDQSMSKSCHEKLTLRQQLQRADYRVNRGLTVACRAHIMNERCSESLQRTLTTGMPEARLSVILLCLENATRFGHTLDPECISELVAVRKSLMADFKLSPEIVSSCSFAIQEHCRNGLEREGKTIHCLMDVARNRVRSKLTNAPSLSDACKKSLGILMREVNVRENFAIDPVLQNACGSIVRTECSNVQPGQGKVMNCLMGLVGQPNIMTATCKKHLMETQYFVSRDFELSPSFYRACQPVFSPVCRVENVRQLSDDQKSDLLLCLYRSRGKSGVSGTCAEAVKQIMIDRAKSVDLEPAIEENCFDSLSRYCSEKTDKNEEMDCLEDHLNDLDIKCKEVVKKYVEEENELPEINQIFMKACEPIIKDHCKQAMASGKDADGNSLINCLIKFKTDTDMSAKCRAGVEHHQLISLKDFSLSRDFKEACTQEVRDHCSNVESKHKVVSCLSEIVRNDLLLGTKPRISAECNRQLNFELLQRSENIKLDPELQEKCLDSLKRLCSDITPGKSAQINCLRKYKDKLEPGCHELVFKRERQEAMDPTTDFALMTKCKYMIKKYCENEMTQPTALFTCLRKNKNQEDFDKGCFQVIIERQRIRAMDVRLNPLLLKYCMSDIKTYCDSEYSNAKTSDKEVEGSVIGCLRKEFAKKTLKEPCRERIRDVIKESALDYVQDIALAKACRVEIRENCSGAVTIDRSDPDRGAIKACLQNLMMRSLISQKRQSPCWTEVSRVLAEDKTDIQVDPVLFKTCSVDLLHVCKDVARGEGRQMSCLIDALNDKTVTLTTDCRRALKDRVTLWNMAVELSPPESIAEMVDHVSASPARNSFLTVTFAIIVIIFVGGLFCGRVTKRVARQVIGR